MIQDEHELELLISSRFPIIALETQEEARALALLRRCALNLKLPVRTWSVTTGLSADPTSATGVTPQDPAAALRDIARSGAPGLWVLLDFHPFLANPMHVRLLKEIASDYERVARTIVLMGTKLRSRRRSKSSPCALRCRCRTRMPFWGSSRRKSPNGSAATAAGN
jgi:hypothetical protein